MLTAALQLLLILVPSTVISLVVFGGDRPLLMQNTEHLPYSCLCLYVPCRTTPEPY